MQDNQFDPEAVFAAFHALGHRPEKLEEVCREAAFGSGSGSLKEVLAGGAEALRARLWEDYEAQHAALSVLQRAVLARLGETGEAFTPFAEATRRAYAEAVYHEVNAQEAQAALEALRERGLVWRSARGSYVLEDQGFATWYRARTTSVPRSAGGDAARGDEPDGAGQRSRREKVKPRARRPPSSRYDQVVRLLGSTLS